MFDLDPGQVETLVRLAAACADERNQSPDGDEYDRALHSFTDPDQVHRLAASTWTTISLGGADAASTQTPAPRQPRTDDGAPADTMGGANVQVRWTTHVTYELVAGPDAVRAALLAALVTGHSDHGMWVDRIQDADAEHLAVIAQGLGYWFGQGGPFDRTQFHAWLDTRERDADIVADTTDVDAAATTDAAPGSLRPVGA